jgi:hypothetical protein
MYSVNDNYGVSNNEPFRNRKLGLLKKITVMSPLEKSYNDIGEQAQSYNYYG